MKKYAFIVTNCLLAALMLRLDSAIASNQEGSPYSAHLTISVNEQRINAKVTVTNNSEEKAFTFATNLGLYGQPSNSFAIIKKSDPTKTSLRFRGSEAKRAPANNEAVASQDTFDLDSLTNSFYVLQPDDFFVLNVELDEYYKFEGSGCYVGYYDGLLGSVTVGFAEEFRSNVVEFCFEKSE
jgi:hypothetical protein